MPDNIDRLRDAGFKIDARTPDPYKDVLQRLSPDEVDALTMMSLRQIEALNSAAKKLGKVQRLRRLSRHWTYYILPP